MARIFFDGFDHGSMKLWDYSSGTLDSSSKVTGAYSFGPGCYCYRDTDRTDITDFYLGFWSYNSGLTGFGFLNLNHTGSVSSWFRYYCGVTFSSSSISFFVGSSLSGGHSYGTTTVSYETNHIQVRLQGSAYGGTVLFQAKVNGALVMNETISSSDTYYCDYIKTIIIGLQKASYSSSSSASGIYLDDFVFDDADWPGPSKIYTLSPSGAGSSTMWQPLSGDNYANVDDIPEDTDDYVYTDTALNLDLYALEDLPSGTAAVKGVQVLALAKTPGPPAYEYLQLALRTGGTSYYSTSIQLYYAYNLISYFWDSNPDTSAEWTPSEINALEAGVRLVSS